jgi:hypothetical protein
MCIYEMLKSGTKFIPYGLFNWWLISPSVRTHPSRL